MNIEGKIVRLRAVEPGDIDRMYAWENDPAIWPISGTTEPFSRYQLEHFIKQQQDADIFRSGQLRLIVESLSDAAAVGAVDLFEFDPVSRRAGIGILIYEQTERGRGYATDAVETLGRYTRDTMDMHQLWCNVGAGNAASLHLFRNAGFIEVGTKREWQWTPDGYRDEVLLQKILK